MICLALIDWRRVAIVAIPVLVALAALPAVLGTFLVHVGTLAFYYTMLAVSWNLLAGMTGQFSLAQQTFAAIGAYTSGLLIVWLDFPLWLAMLCGIAAAAALGFVLGRLVLRMRAIYLAIATWAFAETIHVLLTAAYQITRGE